MATFRRREGSSPTWVRNWAIGLGIAVGCWLFAFYVLPLVLPFVIAVLIAVAIDRPVEFMERRMRVPRGLAVLVVLLAAVVVVALAMTALVGRIAVELEQFVRHFHTYEADLTRWFDLRAKSLRAVYDRLPDPVMGAVDTTGRAAYDRLVDLSRAVVEGVQRVPSAITTLTVAFIAAFFMSRDRVRILNSLDRRVPMAWKSRVAPVRTQLPALVLAYIRAQLTLMGITTAVSLVGLLVLRTRYAWLLALVAGLLDILPMLGPAAMFAPWAVIAFLMGNHVLGLGLGVLWVVTSLLRQIFESKVVGRSLEVHPLVTLISLYICVSLFGVWGFVFGPAVVILGRAVEKAYGPPAGGGSRKGSA